MKTADFHYTLPDELIARYPTPERSASRLLCLNKKAGEVNHRQFKDLPSLLKKRDLLVFNNTRVIPARLFGTKTTGGKVEILVERLLSDTECVAHVRNAKRLKPGFVILLDKGQQLEVLGREGELVKLAYLKGGLLSLLEDQGHMPLPPYIDRKDELSDQERYQTVYGKVSGAVAAPTAGLHFDAGLLAQLDDLGVERTEVTLHVGAGTFQPVRVDDIKDHVMHSEWFSINQQTCDAVNKAKQEGRRIIAVGTTSVRCLESAFNNNSKQVEVVERETDIFITPGYKFKVINGLITNFHLSESTLLMLVSAFAGKTYIDKAYQEAIKEKYRFFSYGDGMLIS